MSTISLPHQSLAQQAPFSLPNKVGMVLAGVLGVADLTVLANPTPPGEVGPPLGILIIDTVLGAITLAAIVFGWRLRRRGLIRLAAGARIVSMITALPAFFAGVPTFLVALVSAFVLLTVAAVILMLLPARRPQDVS